MNLIRVSGPHGTTRTAKPFIGFSQGNFSSCAGIANWTRAKGVALALAPHGRTPSSHSIDHRRVFDER